MEPALEVAVGGARHGDDALIDSGRLEIACGHVVDEYFAALDRISQALDGRNRRAAPIDEGDGYDRARDIGGSSGLAGEFGAWSSP